MGQYKTTKGFRSLWLMVVVLLGFGFSSNAQNQIKGLVLQSDNKGNFEPLQGVILVWMGTDIGVLTDSNGVFEITYKNHIPPGFNTPQLVVSYMGFLGDTISVDSSSINKLRVVLKEENSNLLKEVEITARNQTTFINSITPHNTQTITEKELFKAACCNLSESFETNPSVEVSYTDAATGAKQIQLLGLSGIYSQLLSENIPTIRGLSASMGMSYIPGSWIQSIQLTKGVGSVVNGFESITGLINLELKKPSIDAKNGERIFANVYLNDFGRIENNLNIVSNIGKYWSTATLMHANFQNSTIDQNKDNFYDIALGRQWNALHRWKYENNKGFIFQIGIQGLIDKRNSGEISSNNFNANKYGIDINTIRAESFVKLGYTFPQKKYKSFGIISNAMYHNQNNKFGNRLYDASQKALYLNFIYQSIIQNTNHKFRLGISNQTDSYHEIINFNNAFHFSRLETVTGAFGEYTNTSIARLTLIGGARIDYNSIYGFFVTPRLHSKWQITPKTTLRLAMGKGQRTANILAENSSAFINNRNLVIENTTAFNNSRAYGLKQEVAWNYGFGLTKEFRVLSKLSTIQLDIYRTDFINQVVVDFEQPQFIKFYNLQGKSFSNSLLLEYSIEAIKRMEVKFAYRFQESMTTYNPTLLFRPMVSPHRLFMNVSYATRSKWRFDFTASWTDSKRIPNTNTNPPDLRFPNYSPSYWIFNAQIAKSFGSTQKHWWDVYAGIENIGNFRQQNLIISPQNPSSQYFDTSLIWGPIFGRMMYAGIRYKMK